MKKYISLILSFFLLIANICPVSAAKYSNEPSVLTDAYVVMDADTGQIVYSKNATKKIYPASTTKIMTILLLLESGISLDTTVTVDRSIFTGLADTDSQLLLSDNEVVPLRDLAYGAAVKSANDACYTIAATVGGSVDNFVTMMNERAKEIGCTNTNFVTVNGLHDDDHYSTAYDMAKIMQVAIQNTQFNEIFSAMSYQLTTTNVRAGSPIYNTNLSLSDLSEYYIDGIVCSKTGSTDQAGNVEISYVVRGDKHFIVSVFGYLDSDQRYADSQSLANYVMDNYEKLSIPQNYVTPVLDMPFLYDLSNQDSFYTIDPLDTLYTYNDTETYPVSRKFVSKKLTKTADQGDLAGYYVYYQNGEEIYRQNVYLTTSLKLHLTLKNVSIIIGGALLTFILIFFIIACILRNIAIKKRRRRRRQVYR